MCTCFERTILFYINIPIYLSYSNFTKHELKYVLCHIGILLNRLVAAVHQDLLPWRFSYMHTYMYVHFASVYVEVCTSSCCSLGWLAVHLKSSPVTPDFALFNTCSPTLHQPWTEQPASINFLDISWANLSVTSATFQRLVAGLCIDGDPFSDVFEQSIKPPTKPTHNCFQLSLRKYHIWSPTVILHCKQHSHSLHRHTEAQLSKPPLHVNTH